MGLLSMLGIATTREMDRLNGELSAARSELAGANTRLRMARASGVKNTMGRFDIELNSELKGDRRWDTLQRMETDPHVKGALRLSILPLIKADWSFTPASDDPRDIEIAHFLDAALLRKTNEHFGREVWTQTSFRAQRLPEILTMLSNGFSMFAKSPWRAVGDKQVRDYHWLEPASVDPAGWKLNRDDSLKEVQRTYRRPDSSFEFKEPIPADELSLYVWEMKGARFEGTPFIRPMYGAWYRKDVLQKLAVIFAQKVGAPLPLGDYPKNWSPDLIQKFIDFVEECKGGSPAHGWGAFPQDADGKGPHVEYVGSKVENVDRMRTLVDGENAEIAHGGGSKAQLAGETQFGSRSTADTQQTTESGMVEAVSIIVCEWMMHGVANLIGEAEEHTFRNFAGDPMVPTITVSKITAGEGLENMDLVFKGMTAGAIPKHREMKKQITERLGYTLPDEAYDEPDPLTLVPPGGAAGQVPGARPAKDSKKDPKLDEFGDPIKEDPAADDLTGLALRDQIDELRKIPQGSRVFPDGGGGAKPRGWFRAPTPFEQQFVGLAAIERGLTLHEQLYYSAAAPVLRKAERDIVARVRAGRINSGNFATLRLGKDGPNVKYRGELRRSLLGVLRKVGKFGEEQVREEMARQRAVLREEAA